MGLSSLARNILRVFGMITKKVVPHVMKPRLVARLGRKYVLPKVAKILSKPIPAKLVATGKKAVATVAAKKNQMFVMRRTGAMTAAAARKASIGRKLARVPKSIGKWAWKNKGALTLAGATIGIPVGIDAALRRSSEAKNDNFNNKYLEILKQQQPQQQPYEYFPERQQSIPYFGSIQQQAQYNDARLPFDMMNSYEEPDFSRYGSPLLYHDDNDMALEEEVDEDDNDMTLEEEVDEDDISINKKKKNKKKKNKKNKNKKNDKFL